MRIWTVFNCFNTRLNPLNAELNPICHLLALLGAHHILHVSRIRVNVGVFFKQYNEISDVIRAGNILTNWTSV
jgi:hypothetical protein